MLHVLGVHEYLERPTVAVGLEVVDGYIYRVRTFGPFQLVSRAPHGLGPLSHAADPDLRGLAAATGQALTVPTRLAYVNDLVEPRYLMNAVALNSLAQNGMRIIGPVLAGVLIAAVGSGGTMYVNAAGYLLGLIPLAMLQSRPRPPATRQGKPGEFLRRLSSSAPWAG